MDGLVEEAAELTLAGIGFGFAAGLWFYFLAWFLTGGRLLREFMERW